MKPLPKDKVPSLAGTSLQPFRFPSVRFLEKVQLLGVHCFNSLIAKEHECLFRTSSFLSRCFHAQPANPTQQKQPLQQGSPTPVEASESGPGSQTRRAPCGLGQRHCQEECGSGPRSCVPKTWPQSVILKASHTGGGNLKAQTKQETGWSPLPGHWLGALVLRVFRGLPHLAFSSSLACCPTSLC